MMNTNYRELNIDELMMVAGGKEARAEADPIIDINPMKDKTNGIPRGGKFSVRV